MREYLAIFLCVVAGLAAYDLLGTQVTRVNGEPEFVRLWFAAMRRRQILEFVVALACIAGTVVLAMA